MSDWTLAIQSKISQARRRTENISHSLRLDHRVSMTSLGIWYTISMLVTLDPAVVQTPLSMLIKQAYRAHSTDSPI